jgi:hypothetical protein
VAIVNTLDEIKRALHSHATIHMKQTRVCVTDTKKRDTLFTFFGAMDEDAKTQRSIRKESAGHARRFL